MYNEDELIPEISQEENGGVPLPPSPDSAPVKVANVDEQLEPAPEVAEVPNDAKSVQTPGVTVNNIPSNPKNAGFGKRYHPTATHIVSDLIGKNEIDGGSLISYVGKNYDKLNGFINIPAMLFGPLYLAYRKLKPQAIISMLISLILSNYIGNYLFVVIFFILHGLFANKMYMAHARKDVKKIKTEHTSYSSGEIHTLCMKKGGTSFGSVILVIIISTLLFLGGSYILNKAGIAPNNKGFSFSLPNGSFSFSVTNSEEEIEEEQPKPVGEYNGTINYNPKPIDEVLTVEKPEAYRLLSKEGSNQIEYKYDNLNTISMCDVNIYGVLDYYDAIEYAKMVSKYHNGSELSTKSVNGINWYIFNYESNGKKTLYVSNNDRNEIYVYSFLYVGEDDCSKEELNILNSINYK